MVQATLVQLRGTITQSRLTRNRLLFQLACKGRTPTEEQWLHRFLYTLRLSLQPVGNDTAVWKCYQSLPSLRCIFHLDKHTSAKLIKSNADLNGKVVTMLGVPDISPSGIANNAFHVLYFSTDDPDSSDEEGVMPISQYVDIDVDDIDIRATDIVKNLCWKGLFDSYLDRMKRGHFTTSKSIE